MKNLKNMLGLLVVSTLALVGMTNVKALDSSNLPNECSGKSYYVTYSNDGREYYACDDNLSTVLTKAGTNDVEVFLLKDVELGAATTISNAGNVIVNLNKWTFTIDSSKAITVNGANVTFKNGVLQEKGTSGGPIKVNSNTKASTLTIDKSIEVKGTGTASAFVKVLFATYKTKINLNGKWDLKNEMVDCDSGKDKLLTIDLNADVNGTLSTSSLVSLDAGASVVNVLGGKYNVNKNVFNLKNGTLNISAGTIKSTGAFDAITVTAPDTASGYTNKLNISGGDISTIGTNKYSVSFATGKGTYSISGGTFTSGKDGNNNQLAAINITDQTYLDNHAGMISGGTFVGAVIGGVTTSKGSLTSANATKVLVGNSDMTTDENGNVIVGKTAAQDPEQEPGSQEPGQAGPGDDEPSKSPATFDAIGSLVTMAISSLGVVGTATKKLFR